MDEARSSYFAAAERDPSNGRYEFECSCISWAQERWELGLELAQAAAAKAPANNLYAAQVQVWLLLTGGATAGGSLTPRRSALYRQLFGSIT